MALQASTSTPVGVLTTVPTITPTASDTIADTSFGTTGIILIVTTTGTATNVVVADPGSSPLSNPGTAPTLACPATGIRWTILPPAAINRATALATVTFSGALTGVTYQLVRV